MSHAHSECAKEIKRVLEGAGMNGFVRTVLYDAISCFGKSEKIFGSCLSAMIQAGDVVEIRIAEQKTRYAMRSLVKPQRSELPRPGQITIPRPTHARAKGEWATVSKRRERLLKTIDEQPAPVTIVKLTELLPEIAMSAIQSDTQVLRVQGKLASRTSLIEGRLIGRWWPAKKAWPGEVPYAEAPAAAVAAPASAPVESAAPHGAADPAEWKALDELLEKANYRAQDAHDSYIAATCDSETLRNLRESITSTRAALELHRQRKPA